MNDNEYQDRKHSREVWAWFGIGVMIAILLLSLILVLNSQGNLLLEIVKALGIFAGGFGGGYGFSALRRRE